MYLVTVPASFLSEKFLATGCVPPPPATLFAFGKDFILATHRAMQVLHWPWFPAHASRASTFNRVRDFALPPRHGIVAHSNDHTLPINGWRLFLLDTIPHLNVMKPSQSFSFDQTRGAFHSHLLLTLTHPPSNAEAWYSVWE